MSADPTALYSRKNPFPAKLKTNRSLTGPGSAKDTRHFEIDLADSGLAYEVGDSLGVFPTNNPVLVEEILGVLGFSGEEEVTDPNGNTITIREALTRSYVITEKDKKLLAAIAEKDPTAAHFIPMTTPEGRAELEAYVAGREVIDPLLAHPAAKFTPEEFVKCLRKLQPRLYSIASSQKANPSEVHLTVAAVRYETHGRKREGVCSTFLSDRADNVPVPVFVHTAKHFRVPEDPSTHAIMVGPGTGIAPFMAFLQERKATGATGKNWLFFGDQKSATDFLYREELEAWQKEGVLHKLSTAFSRDQAEKVYVQHRMLEEAEELFAWLEQGGYFYICGDASRMAKDVDTALHQVVEKAGGKSPEEAAAYVEELKKSKRYRKDVY
ncbi:MAG: sulfite reductase subunit alpha [Verrucomicrobia bacterium]|nr:sulfite reductase subunit alpha [Verrucomicrobiota bacterium]